MAAGSGRGREEAAGDAVRPLVKVWPRAARSVIHVTAGETAESQGDEEPLRPGRTERSVRQGAEPEPARTPGRVVEAT